MPVEFFTDVYKLLGLLEGRWPDESIKNVCGTLEAQIRAKLAARERREAFTAYKTTAAGTDEREQHRQNYLNAAGVSQDWRTKKETNV